MVVVLLLIIFSPAVLAEMGCYLYSESSEDIYCQEISRAEAEADCSGYSDCSDVNEFFIPENDCTTEPECAEILCNVDCQQHALGKCAWLGTANYEISGEAVLEESAECGPGCCLISAKNDCSLKSTLYECQRRAENYGDLTSSDALFSPAISTLGECLARCDIETPPPERGEIGEEGTITLHGQVADQSGTAVSQATVYYKGPSEGSVITALDGNYQIERLLPGMYQVTASKLDHLPEKKTVNLESNFELDFILEKAIFEGIQGTAYVDLNDNDQKDADENLYGVYLYVDGVFNGLSNYPDGEFSIKVSAGEHNLTAAYLNYETQLELIVPSGGTITTELFLTRFVGECSLEGDNPFKKVETFSLFHIPGQEAVSLEWSKPCAEVRGYTVDKISESKEQPHWQIFSPATHSFVDRDVKWGKTYTYHIRAVYTDGELRHSAESNVQSITLGSPECEDRFSELTGWETFCLIDNSATEIKENKIVYTCNDLNLVISTGMDCLLYETAGTDYYCAKISSREASCKDAGICLSLGNPFGLYISPEICYAAAQPRTGNELNTNNFCYYDHSDSIVDRCISCAGVQSCFDYRSEDACLINNCRGEKCRWLNGAANTELLDYSILMSGLDLPLFVTPETGAGYCVEEDYQDDNKCNLCGHEATVFENYFCTAEICSALGRCFSEPLNACHACGDTSYTSGWNCYSYGTKSECIGTQPIAKDEYHRLTLSQDQCGWERCLWLDTNEVGFNCVKDGNADGLEDCSRFPAGENIACSQDNLAPKTTIIPEGLQIVSLGSPEINFRGEDETSPLGTVNYCLTTASSNSPDLCYDSEGKNPFGSKPYPGKSSTENRSINFADYFAERNLEINGETWKLKYYSQDRYFNQEDVKETFIFVDNIPPAFSIKEEIATSGDLTTLTVYLDNIEEPMACTFNLIPVLPRSSYQVRTVERRFNNVSVQFKDLNGVRFDLEVSCEDDRKNVNKKTKNYVFNFDSVINLIYPKEAESINTVSVVFKVGTTVGSFCSLYQNDNYLADFVTDTVGKVHSTSPITVHSGSTADLYRPIDSYSAVCKELLNASSEHRGYFLFYLDFTDVSTKITLKENSRQVTYHRDGWEETFINSALVSLECQPKDYGLGCGDTFYCLDESSHCQEYFQPFILNRSARICYYSLSETGGEGRKDCGEIVIDGYGINLENPVQYYFQGEKWGITNKPLFDWKYYSIIPTIECGFNWLPNFDYTSLEPYKIKLPYQQEEKTRYLYSGFPDLVYSPYRGAETKVVYVQCKDESQKIGPEQKFYLEYDPTAPQINEAYARPDNVVEGTFTDLFVSTNDKTLCRYSDNSSGGGSSEYGTMEFGFPAGRKNNQLAIEHRSEFTVRGVDDSGKKNYYLTVQCRNGAGNLSEVEPVEFKVDYTALGYIFPSSLQPSGYINYVNISLYLETSKNAYCEYSYNGSYRSFQGGGTRMHHSEPLRLIEKEHQFLVKCLFGDQQVYEQIVFTIDLTPPVITSVDDYNYSCGSDLTVMVYSNEQNLSAYYYEVYNHGISPALSSSAAGTISNIVSSISGNRAANATNYSRSRTYTQTNTSRRATSAGILVFNATVGPDLPLKIPKTALNESHSYTVKVTAADAAGNWLTTAVESDGTVVTSKNYSACAFDESAPQVIFNVNSSSCTEILVQMQYQDDVSFRSFKYGQHLSSSSCSPTLNYNGQQIAFDGAGWLCYSIEDSMGNKYNGSRRIDFVDRDGDKVKDENSCDKCLNTGAGKVVNEFGCADGQSIDRSRDTDRDGLPDTWENSFDKIGCEFDFNSSDSDNNGRTDSADDYDNDGYTNFEEYTNAYNPCLADLPPVGEERISISPVSPPEKENKILAIIFLVLGLLLVLGGTGYLVYYYTQKPSTLLAKPGVRLLGMKPALAGSTAKPSMLEGWKQKLRQLQKSRQKKVAAREREEVFGKFNRGSTIIPHVNTVLRQPAPSLSHLHQLANRYAENKEMIKPGLRPEEKSVFSKLESIAKKTQDRDIKEVVSKSEAKDIFSQLKEISKKRKGK